MKLLYIAPRLGGAGGLQRILLLKAGYLAEKKGYDVTILVTNPDTQQVAFPVFESITIKYITPQSGNPVSYFFAYRKAVTKAVKEIQPDVVVICDNGFKSLFLRDAIPAAIPVVYEMHATQNTISDALKGNILGRLFSKATLAFVNRRYSKFTRFVALTREGADEWDLDNSAIIPNPLWFHVKVQSSLASKKVVAMGRHVPIKGYGRMLDIWKRISVQFPDWSLDIYGESNPEYDLKAMTAKLGISNVNFFDPVSAIETVYNNASVNIMTSLHESFGMVLIEAMACGVPCVAYDCPVGPRAIINDDENGFLITDGDEDAFVSRLSQLMQSHELRQQLGSAAKQTASRYDMETIMGQWDALFKSLIKGA